MKQTILLRGLLVFIILVGTKMSYGQQENQTSMQDPGTGQMLIRLSEIEIFPAHLEEYTRILEAEASASVKLEPGVLAIFPMHQLNEPTQIRIIEIYANQKAYEAHLQTPHFKHYKTSTLKMVKSLKLVDMASIDPATMSAIFKKMK